MARYVDRIVTPPPTLSDEEQRRLLQVTGEGRAGFRDHVSLALALGTGLREHEIAALDVGDVATPEGPAACLFDAVWDWFRR